MHLYYRFALDFDLTCVGQAGDFDVDTSGFVQSSLEYDHCKITDLT